MPSDPTLRGAPCRWHDALSALPVEPSESGWTQFQARLDAQERGRRTRTVGAATALAATLALALSWFLVSPDRQPVRRDAAAGSARHAEADRRADSSPAAPARAAESPLASLQAESARLEVLLAASRNDRVTSALAMAAAQELDRRIGRIDAALQDPTLDAEQAHLLWQQRVITLHDLTALETSERWLALQGSHLDDAMVRVD